MRRLQHSADTQYGENLYADVTRSSPFDAPTAASPAQAVYAWLVNLALFIIHSLVFIIHSLIFIIYSIIFIIHSLIFIIHSFIFIIRSLSVTYHTWLFHYSSIFQF
jgi:hypothetical protein